MENALGFQTAYRSLRAKLTSYHEGLPGKLSQGLAENALHFYNAMNRGDPEFQKFAELTLPESTNSRVSVKFRGSDVAHDALHIMTKVT